MPDSIKIGAIPAHLLHYMGFRSTFDPYPNFLVVDNFDAVNGVETSDRTPQKDSAGSGWQSGVSWPISNSRLPMTGTDGDEIWIDAGEQNHYIEAALTDSGGGLVVRFTSSDQYYVAQVTDANTLTIYRNNSGFISLGAAVVTWVASDVLRLEVTDSNDFLAFQNDTLVVSASDTTISTAATRVGIRSIGADTVDYFDNLRVGLSSGV